MDYVIVQGMSHSNRSVSQYYLMTSTDNDNYEEILISGRNRRQGKICRISIKSECRNLLGMYSSLRVGSGGGGGGGTNNRPSLEQINLSFIHAK